MLLPIFNTILIIILLIIVIHDFRYRQIYAYLLPIMALVCVMKIVLLLGFDSFTALNWGINALIISCQFLLLWLYFGVLKKRNLKSMIGLGDILFLYAIIFSLPTLYFIITCVSAFSVALLAKLIAPSKFSTIPLAGWVAVILIMVLFIETLKKQTCWDWIYLL